MRTRRELVTFQHPFSIKGVDAVQPSGTYVVLTDEEEIPGLSFVARHRVGTMFRIPSVDVDTGTEQLIPIHPKDLAAALAADVEATNKGDEHN